ncbi:MAG TPA: hypothetical protein VEB20_19090 [Azospirillaceae bacterium]|nr:hypothetical protein [Azospirillaceae bacterium]
MTAHCYLIGIGGSGSRVLEAALHMTAAGLGPRKMWIGHMDPDRGNGNIGRLKRLSGQYADLQASLRKAADQALAPKAHFLRTEVTAAEPDLVWSPVPDGRRDLRALFGARGMMRPAAEHLFESLFHPREEQTLDLEVGFRGRPAIGAAVIAATANGESPFWTDLLRVKRDLGSGVPVRIFLTGSIFGGTGAAGLPTVARVLRSRLAEAGMTDFRIGAGVLLPYFGYTDPDDDEQVVAARSAAFLSQSQGALRYYHQTLAGSGKPIFDSMTVLGWPRPIQLEGFDIGGQGQSNPPMAPELLAALACLDFFSDPEPEPRAGVRLLAADETKPLGWSDLPSVPGTTGEPERSVKDLLGGLVRFAAAYHRLYYPALRRGRSRDMDRQSWLRAYFGGVDLDGDAMQKPLARLDDYCADLLRWAGSIQRLSGNDPGLALFNLGELVDDRTEADGMLALRRGLGAPASFDDLIVGADAASDLADILDALSRGRGRGGHGLGRFVQALHGCCLPRALQSSPEGVMA